MHALLLDTETAGLNEPEIIADYEAWALKNLTDMDPYLRKALEDVQ